MKNLKFISAIFLFAVILLPAAVCGAQQQQKKGVSTELIPDTVPPPVPSAPDAEDDYEGYEGEEFYDEEESESTAGAQNRDMVGAKTQNQGAEKGPNAAAETRRSRVANAVQETLKVANRAGGIGEQIRTIAQAQNQNQEQMEAGLKAVKNRGQLKKFFFGPDYKSLKTVEERLANHAARITELKSYLGQISNQEDKALLRAQIQVMEQAALEIKNEANSEKKGFSLFGWLNRMLSN